MNKELISIKDLNAEEKAAGVWPGMTVEYSDPKGDQDTGNFGTVTGVHSELHYKAFTEEEFYIHEIDLELFHGQKVTITSGQLLARTLGEMDEI